MGSLADRGSGASSASDSGFVVGISAVAGRFEGEPWAFHACRWYAGNLTDLGTLLPDPPPGTSARPSSGALGVTELGRVVGWSDGPAGVSAAFLWLPKPGLGLPVGMSALPVPDPSLPSLARRANDQAWIVGEHTINSPSGPTTRAALWRFDAHPGAWTFTDPGTLGGPTARAAAINASGQICGRSADAAGRDHAFLWLPLPAFG